jgi:hypothetical protein
VKWDYVWQLWLNFVRCVMELRDIAGVRCTLVTWRTLILLYSKLSSYSQRDTQTYRIVSQRVCVSGSVTPCINLNTKLHESVGGWTGPESHDGQRAAWFCVSPHSVTQTFASRVRSYRAEGAICCAESAWGRPVCGLTELVGSWMRLVSTHEVPQKNEVNFQRHLIDLLKQHETVSC